MNDLHIRGALIKSDSLVRVIYTDSFQGYVKSNRPNTDGSHADIIKKCGASDETYQDMLDDFFGIKKLSNNLVLGGRLTFPSA